MAGAKQKILDAATALAAKHGFRNVTRSALANRVGIATGTVSYHYGNMHQLQEVIMEHAVQTQNAVIVAQGLAEGHKAAKTAPQALRTAAAKLMAGVA